MYSSCLYCLGDLGSNRVLRNLPTGRAIAFDPTRGRVWVVCPVCARWNLMPIGERWELLEEAERTYAECGRRVESGQIGVAVLEDGTRLVRVGAASPFELASWRYGAKLRAKTTVDRAMGVLHRWFGGTLLSPGVFGRHRVIHALGGEPSRPVRRSDLDGAQFDLDASQGRLDVTLRSWRLGDTPAAPESARLLERILLSVNRDHAGPRTLDAAVRYLDRYGDGLIGSLADTSSDERQGILRLRYEGEGSWRGEWSPDGSGFLAISRYRTLALEMALQEDSERRALEEDLSALERRWREAEALAKIADGL